MKWKKILTRPYTLIAAYYSQTCYPTMPFPIKNDFIIGRNGMVERFLDENELIKLYKYIKTNKNSLKSYFHAGLKVDRELTKIIKKDPLKNFTEFHQKYLEYWPYSLFAFWTGYVLNEKELNSTKKEIEFIRGQKAVKNKIEEKYFSDLLKQLAKKTKISSSLLAYATPEEIMANKFDLAELAERKKLFVWMIKGQKNIFCTGMEAEKIIKKELHLQPIDYSSFVEVKGEPAYHGIVRGTAKILLDPGEKEKVKKGDILFTYMTNPQFSPAMKKAAAWVTDEGGLACHAAIIAREAKISCIVGTKNSTKIFKDGDLVEVDAGKGIVRKI